MQVPRASHIQLLVLGTLAGGPSPGRAVREELEQFGAAKSGPAFYQLMSRLEERQLVEGWYEQEVVDGQIIRQRFYRITALGSEAWDEGRHFYSHLLGEAEGIAGA